MCKALFFEVTWSDVIIIQWCLLRFIAILWFFIAIYLRLYEKSVDRSKVSSFSKLSIHLLLIKTLIQLSEDTCVKTCLWNKYCVLLNGINTIINIWKESVFNCFDFQIHNTSLQEEHVHPCNDVMIGSDALTKFQSTIWEVYSNEPFFFIDMNDVTVYKDSF